MNLKIGKLCAQQFKNLQGGTLTKLMQTIAFLLSKSNKYNNLVSKAKRLCSLILQMIGGECFTQLVQAVLSLNEQKMIVDAALTSAESIRLQNKE